MKTIAIVVDRDMELAELLKSNLLKVFDGVADINIYRIQYLEKNEKISDDVVLAMTRERAIEIFEHVDEREKVVVIQRTITLNAFVKLLTIPCDSRVLVVNDNYSTTIEFTTYLSSILKILKLEPYLKGMDTSGYDVIVTPNEMVHAPSNIDTVFNTGHRILDGSTFIQIMSILKINDTEINNRLLEYFNTIAFINNGVNEKFIEIVDKGQILEALLENTADGILILDNCKGIKFYNEKFKAFLNIKEDIVRADGDYILKKYISDEDLQTKIIKNNKVDTEIWIKDNRYFSFSKITIIKMGKVDGYLINIAEITYIKKIEQNLTGKLIQNGQIARYFFDDIYTKSEKLGKVIALSKRVAESDYSVMIQGESGTGKELFAQAIHNHSDRKSQPFLAINCAALPEQLLESELFGYVGGSFTGALKEGKKGLFENANNGTIFLDEIGDMPVNLQSKLLRVLQEKQISKLGSHEIISIDVRMIAATHKNLLKQIELGQFRADLYYRLNVIPIQIPPLRERKEDIIDLFRLFIGKNISIDEGTVKILQNYPWNGNVRELQNTSKYIHMMLEESKNITQEHLPDYIPAYFGGTELQIEKPLISKKLEILKSIMEMNSCGKSSGRKSLSKLLSQKHIFLSEGEIRGMFEKLKEDKYIETVDKRAGTKITQEGIRFVEMNDQPKTLN